jgi:peptidoglycan/LPS O-acetylase OafA/YrhL
MLQLVPNLGVYWAMLLDTVIVFGASAVLYYVVDQPIRRYGWKAYVSRSRRRPVHEVVAPRPPD